ncbi:MAG: uroporphyrinogen decarboxylase family protein [Prevotella sp.]|nr:uroporphyrinogen decarboxylase family protein [Prevotella sp.]
MKQDMKRWIASLISDNRVAAIPIMTHPGIELNGKTVREAVSDGRVHADAIATICQRYASAAATTIMDLTTEAEAFGAQIVMSDDAVPAVTGRLLNDVSDIAQLKIPTLNAARIPAYLKACLMAAREVDRPLFGGCIGPFSLAGRLFDMSDIMVLIYENPDAAHELLDKATTFITKYCRAIRETGANGVMMAEPAAGLLSNDDCITFSSQYVKRIVEDVQNDDFIVVLHNCGNTGHCTRAMVQTGAAAYHFGNKCKMAEVIADVPDTALAMGNIDPVGVFKDGTRASMTKAVEQLMNEMKSNRNFVISSGCDTPPHTPFSQIDAFFEAVESVNCKRNN